MGNKLYTATIIKELQNAININKILITPYKDYSFINPGIKSCGQFIKFYIDDKGRHNKLINASDEFNLEAKQLWKTYAINKFLYKDWKNDKKNTIGNSLYYELKFVTSSGEKLRALIRKLIEVNEDELTAQEKLDFIKNYCDIIIDNKYYSVLKISSSYEDSFYWTEDDKKSIINFSCENTTIDNTNTDEDTTNISSIQNENIDEGLF